MSSRRAVPQDPPSGSPPQPDPVIARRWPVVGLVLAALLLVVGVVGVLRVQRRVEATGSSGFTVADQEAIEADVAHRVVEVKGILLADGSP